MTSDEFSDSLVLLVEVNNLITEFYWTEVQARGQDGYSAFLSTLAAAVDTSTYVINDGKFLLNYHHKQFCSQLGNIVYGQF